MKIKDIRHVSTNETRTDGRYPLRIGCTVRFFNNFRPQIGNVMLLEYIYDNNGGEKDGYLRTSTVYGVEEDNEEIVVETRNSIYIFEK